MRRHKSAALDPVATGGSPSSSTSTPTNDDDRPMRRVSYLRATANDSSLQLLDAEADAASAASASAAAATAGGTSTASPTGTDGAQLGALLARSPDGVGYDAQTIAQQLKR